MPKKKSYEEVKRIIDEVNTSGTVLLSKEYETTKKPLLFKCECGRTFERTYEKFINGAFKCPECKKKALSEMYKYTLDDVKKIISDAGCEYISGEYNNNQSLLTIRCSCGEVFQKRLIKFNSGQNKCARCRSVNYKGENSHFYKNGCSEVYSAIREALLLWKKDVRELYDDTCPITGERGELCDVHHIVPLEAIYKPIADEYGIVINSKTKINELPSYEVLDDIRKRVLKAHSLDIGILISKKVHYGYHAIYKGMNCTEDNFADFLRKTYGVELSEIRRQNERSVRTEGKAL